VVLSRGDVLAVLTPPEAEAEVRALIRGTAPARAGD